MFQIHLEKCSSTQDYFKDHWRDFKTKNPQEEFFLVSTDLQQAGKGRQGKIWNHFKNNLAFSFNLKPNDEKTLTSLEVGVLISQYMEKNGGTKIFLKWPNDLINDQGKKVGGILCQFQNPDLLVVGCGLNLFLEESEQGKLQEAGSLLSAPPSSQWENFSQKCPYEITHFIHTQRINLHKVRQSWCERCMHLNSRVKIVEYGQDQKGREGIFIGLGPRGEALLKDLEGEEKDKTFSFMEGHLYFPLLT